MESPTQVRREGAILYRTIRTLAEGAWVKLKKPTLEALLVIDPRELPEAAKKKLQLAYDEPAKMEIQALPQIGRLMEMDGFSAKQLSQR